MGKQTKKTLATANQDPTPRTSTSEVGGGAPAATPTSVPNLNVARVTKKVVKATGPKKAAPKKVAKKSTKKACATKGKKAGKKATKKTVRKAKK